MPGCLSNQGLLICLQEIRVGTTFLFETFLQLKRGKKWQVETGHFLPTVNDIAVLTSRWALKPAVISRVK